MTRVAKAAGTGAEAAPARKQFRPGWRLVYNSSIVCHMPHVTLRINDAYDAKYKYASQVPGIVYPGHSSAPSILIFNSTRYSCRTVGQGVSFYYTYRSSTYNYYSYLVRRTSYEYKLQYIHFISYSKQCVRQAPDLV